MLKFITSAIVVSALCGVFGKPQDSAGAQVPTVVSLNQMLDGQSGAFLYNFETSDGIKEEATGSLKNIKLPEVDPASGRTAGVEEGLGE